tara:strand:+ start:1511 stop:2833 length:1323 start_codon:yes stop_codon:yes gene_type:complete
MAAQDISIIEKFEILSNDGKLVDIKNGVIKFEYTENLLSPMVTASVFVVNTGTTVLTSDGEKRLTSLYNGLPLNGGEIVNIKIPATSDGPGLEFTQKNNNPLYVGSITDILINSSKETFVLNLVSREAITNETVRVGKKFGPKISESVEKIIKEELKTEKNIDKDETENDYAFLGNMRKPFTLITWLMTKSVSAKAGGQNSTAGYFFYETRKGYHFKSIDNLIKSKKFEKKYTYTPGVVDNEDPNKDFKILDYYTEQNQRLIENLERGAYCTYRMYYDPLNGKFTTQEEGLFQVSKYADKMENLGQDLKVLLPPIDNKTKLGNVPSRFVTGVIDRGITEKSAKNSKKQNANQMEYHSQAMMRYQTICTQSLQATIPLNTNLIAGNIIDIEFPLLTTSKDKVSDDTQSGLYMIKALTHIYESRGSFTKLKLIRDTTGKKDK